MSNVPLSYPNRAQALRARILGQQVAPARPVEIDGEKYFIRTALQCDRTKIGEIAGLSIKATKDGAAVDMSSVSMAAMTAAALIVLAVDEVGNPLCSAVDLDALVNTPAGGWAAQLGEACLRSANGVTKGEDSGEAKKESGSPSSSPTVSG